MKTKTALNVVIIVIIVKLKMELKNVIFVNHLVFILIHKVNVKNAKEKGVKNVYIKIIKKFAQNAKIV